MTYEELRKIAAKRLGIPVERVDGIPFEGDSQSNEICLFSDKERKIKTPIGQDSYIQLVEKTEERPKLIIPM